MKNSFFARYFAPALVAVCIAVAIVACTTSQVSTAAKTLATVEITTKTAYDGYLTLVVTGKVRTNEVPAVSKAFNDFQAAMVLAVVSVQNNTNALAPDSLVQEGQAVINLISTVKGN
jgi:hypothetical protein